MAMPRYALVTVVRTFASGTVQPAPLGLVGTARAQLWASTSGSAGATATSGSTGGGSGGAGYSEEPALAITGGYTIVLPAGGAGGAGSVGSLGTNPGDSTITGDSVTVIAHPGGPGTCSNSNGALGAGAPASSNTIAFGGGNASSGVSGGHGGAGGGSAGSAGAGGAASFGTGGSAGTPDGAAGANGQAAANSAGVAGASPGGGAGGARGGAVRPGGQGGTGKAILTYQVLVPLGGSAVTGRPQLRKGSSRGSAGAPVIPVGPPVPSVFYAPQQAQKGRSLLRRGSHAQAKGAPVQPPPPFHLAPFRSPGPIRGRKLLRRGSARHQGGAPVVPFPASVVNQWAGVVTHSPAWGTSLPGIASVAVDLTPANAVIPGSGTPTQGNWLFAVAGWNSAAGLPAATIGVGDDSHQWWRPQQPSNAAGGTRTTIWRQPNVIPPSCVYVSPSAYVDGLAVTVIEVGGMGPWDELIAVQANELTGTNLPLALGAPGAGALFIAAVTGSSAAAGTALAPAGWTPLATVTAINGADSASDTVLASAYITSAAAQSIAGTASSAEALSGMILAVLQRAPSPVPGGGNASWPYLRFEAAFGSGYMTPPDEMTWTDLQASFPPRLLSWTEGTGMQYELDALESTEAQVLLDNPDGALSPANPASPYYPGVVPGTPVRIRAVPPGGDRELVIQRNVERWPQTWNDVLRGETNTVVTDIWSVVNKELPTCYRAEVLADLPYAWWPCDDPPVGNPTSLVNAAPGNATPLQIVVSPSGLAASVTVGFDSAVFLFSAIQAFAADSGWMYGDSDSAAWQQTGSGSITTGRYLYCQDPSFPPLANGITIEGWWNYTWRHTAPPVSTLTFGPDGQPAGNIVLWGIGSGGTGTAQLFIDSSGHLKLTAGGMTTTLYSATDLAASTWFGVTVTLTPTGWQAWMNGGIVAHASGSATMASSWDTFTANASITGSTVTNIGNPEVSHLAIYPVALPAPRVIAHFTAAYTAFGQLPQPTGLTQQFIPNMSYAPDGINHAGAFFQPPATFIGTNSTLAAYVTGAAGSNESATVIPESWDWCQTVGSDVGAAGDYGWLTASGPAAPVFNWYTSGSSGNEKLAATTVSNTLYVNSYGTGASPPAAASSGGDTVQNRIERILQAGGVTTPVRCIDAQAAAVVASIDTGGQAAGSNLSNIATSDSGLAFIDNVANICYFSRPRLTAQPVLWQLGADLAAGQIPYEFQGSKAGLDTDPQRVMNDIQVTQADVTGGSGGGAASGSAETHGGLVFGPDASRYPGVLASQLQNGNCQARTTSYLQDQALIQAQANWLFDEFGQPRQRITNLMVRAEAAAVICPDAWQFVLGANVGDVMQVFFTPPGQPPFSGLWRISKITARTIKFGLDETEASITVIGDVYTTEWGT